MFNFDINAVIEEYSIDVNELASILFPNAKYKKQALDRVIKYESTIDVDQLARLAEHLNVSIEKLYNTPGFKTEKSNGYITLIRGEYKVALNKDGFYYSIYKGNELVDRLVEGLGQMKLDDFIPHINNIINNYENGPSN